MRIEGDFADAFAVASFFFLWTFMTFFEQMRIYFGFPLEFSFISKWVFGRWPLSFSFSKCKHKKFWVEGMKSLGFF